MKVTNIISLWRMVGSMMKFVACNISDIFLYPSSGIHCNIELKLHWEIQLNIKRNLYTGYVHNTCIVRIPTSYNNSYLYIIMKIIKKMIQLVLDSYDAGMTQSCVYKRSGSV